MAKKEKRTKEPKVVVQDPHAIPFNEQLAYGAGAFMDGGGVALMACILVKYMESLGIATWIATLIFMLAKVWDAISDPLMDLSLTTPAQSLEEENPISFSVEY